MASSEAVRLYDLFILGLSYLDAEKSEKPRRGAGIIHAMHIAGKVTAAQWRSLERNTALISYTMGQVEIIRANRRLPKAEIDRRVAASERHAITLVIPGGQLFYPKLFGPTGYDHIVTASGMEYARTVQRSHTDAPSRDEFMEAWTQHVRQVSAMNARGNERG